MHLFKNKMPKTLDFEPYEDRVDWVVGRGYFEFGINPLATAFLLGIKGMHYFVFADFQSDFLKAFYYFLFDIRMPYQNDTFSEFGA